MNVRQQSNRLRTERHLKDLTLPIWPPMVEQTSAGSGFGWDMYCEVSLFAKRTSEAGPSADPSN